METLIVGLVLALVTGLAWIAYNHSVEFQKISNVIWWFNQAGLLAMLAYNLGVSQGKSAAMLVYIKAHADAKVDDAAQAAAQAVSIPWSLVVLTFFFGIYVAILSMLPHMLKLPNRDPKP
jgi:uncharacterized protein YacL